MFKYCSSVICPYITHIINCCNEQGYFPTIWKSSVVIPLPKNNSPKNYIDLRPVNILPALFKVIEKVVYSELNDYVISNKIIPDSQSGFRKGFSTTSTWLDITDDTLRVLDSGLATALILLDFTKALIPSTILYYHLNWLIMGGFSVMICRTDINR